MIWLESEISDFFDIPLNSALCIRTPFYSLGISYLTKIILNVYDKFEETFLTKLEKKKGKRFAAEAKLQGELNKAFFDERQVGYEKQNEMIHEIDRIA